MSGEKRTYRTFYTGAIKEIFALFVSPIAKALAPGEEENSLDHGIHRLFHSEEREVYFARATETFMIRNAAKWSSAQSPQITETGYRAVRVDPGDGFVVRLDDTMPDRIDIEINDDVYSLKWAEWEVIRGRVEFVG